MAGLYNYEQDLSSVIAKITQSGLSEQNKKLIFGFREDCVLRGLSKPRIVKCLTNLKRLAEWLGKDFDKADKEDVKHVVGVIQGADYSLWTKHGFKVILKRFYKWLYQTEEYPPLVSWIKNNVKKSLLRLPGDGDLLTEGDIQKLLITSNHIRDKAFVAMLWESGCRVGEVGSLKIKNLSADKHGFVISVFGKTGSRQIRLIFSVPYLSMWLNIHPLRDDREAVLWVNIGNTCHNKPLTYASISKMLKNLFKQAGIKKRPNPHLFRHSRATFLANHLTEFQMNQYFGWTQGSEMPSTYVHMSGREIDDKILELNGLKVFTEKKVALQPRICPRCDTLNTEDATYCLKCGGVLDLKIAIELQEEQNEYEKARKEKDDLMTQLLQDKEVQNVLMHKLKALKINILKF